MDWLRDRQTERQTHTHTILLLCILFLWFFSFLFSKVTLLSLPQLLLSTYIFINSFLFLSFFFRAKYPKGSHFRNEFLSALLLFLSFSSWLIILWPGISSLTFYSVRHADARSLNSLERSHILSTGYLRLPKWSFNIPV